MKNLRVNLALDLVGLIQYLHLVRASYCPRRTAARTLRSILKVSRDTTFGREHDFAWILSARTDDELFNRYSQKVAASDYEAFRPYVDRMKSGEENVLFPGKPLCYGTTSGTTNKPKFVPISSRYLKRVYSKMSQLWLYTLICHRPDLSSGRILTMVGKDVEGYTEDGTPFGSVSGITEKNVPGFIKALFACPDVAFKIDNYEAKYYTIMRFAIEHDVRAIATPNPSTVLELENNVLAHLDEYLEDMEHGTLKADLEIDPDIRRELESKLRPNPARAAELRRMKEQYGDLYPRHYWPNMRVLNMWRCGNTRMFFDKVRPTFPEDMTDIEIGYFATECRFGLGMDTSANTVLMPHFHYYEFVPEEDINKKEKRFLQIDQLEPGKRYCSYVTTYSGLYRYNMNDLIEVGGFFKDTPVVHMVQKINGIISITGEKLYEKQFIDAVNEAGRVTGLKPRFFVGFANPEMGNYDFFYEFINSKTPKEKAEEFTKFVDAVLIKINTEYKAKRESNRLKKPSTHRLPERSFEKYKQKCLKEGARDGQFKIVHLMQDKLRQRKFAEMELRESE